MWTIHEIALRRHHRTEHVWMKDVSRRFNAQMTEYRQEMRVSNIVRAVLDVVEGPAQRATAPGRPPFKSPEECFGHHRIKWSSVPWHCQKQLQTLWDDAAKRNSDPVTPLSPAAEADTVLEAERVEKPINPVEDET